MRQHYLRGRHEREGKAVQMVVQDHLRLADLLELLTVFKIDFVGGFLRHGCVRVF